jgi:hypothetical protein
MKTMNIDYVDISTRHMTLLRRHFLLLFRFLYSEFVVQCKPHDLPWLEVDSVVVHLSIDELYLVDVQYQYEIRSTEIVDDNNCLMPAESAVSSRELSANRLEVSFSSMMPCEQSNDDENEHSM